MECFECAGDFGPWKMVVGCFSLEHGLFVNICKECAGEHGVRDDETYEEVLDLCESWMGPV